VADVMIIRSAKTWQSIEAIKANAVGLIEPVYHRTFEAVKEDARSIIDERGRNQHSMFNEFHQFPTKY